MKLVTVVLLLCSISFSIFAQQESSLFTQRGLIKQISSEADPYKNERYRMMVTLIGTRERAACPKVRLNESDIAGIEVLKMAILLNRPVEITFHIVKGKREEVADHPLHCQAESVVFKPE